MGNSPYKDPWEAPEILKMLLALKHSFVGSDEWLSNSDNHTKWCRVPVARLTASNQKAANEWCYTLFQLAYDWALSSTLSPPSSEDEGGWEAGGPGQAGKGCSEEAGSGEGVGGRQHTRRCARPGDAFEITTKDRYALIAAFPLQSAGAADCAAVTLSRQDRYTVWCKEILTGKNPMAWNDVGG
ncbi:hypothetical protein FN846DRAFT_891548 [Sphaerosporella brunnea]|uniref:Uncharacterized protein n=1 Tax=Sphaerosporella brunnea TaxID=1250544 RepID=A0A5J5ET01_9PEZI|nr:hypothetical protein FN846DRAFT_891548 [Sphaerosporella brunnea]